MPTGDDVKRHKFDVKYKFKRPENNNNGKQINSTLSTKRFRPSALAGNCFRNYCFQNIIGEGGCAYIYFVETDILIQRNGTGEHSTFQHELLPSFLKKSSELSTRAPRKVPGGSLDQCQNKQQKLLAAKVSKRPRKFQCRRELDSWTTELDILTSVQHDNVLKCLECFHIEDHVIIITEYVEGQDLFDLIKECDSIPINSRSIACQMFEALDSLHYNYSIAHMDLKVENVLVDKTGHIKLCDFGSAVRIPPDGKIGTSGITTPSILPPEYFTQKSCDPRACDIWSAGIILFVLLCQRYPHGHNNPLVISMLQYEQRLDFSGIDINVFHDMIHLIRQCLEIDLNLRITSKDALKFDFFKIKM